jgi:hypothetical protein
VSDRVDWLRAKFRTALRHGISAMPNYSWAEEIRAPVSKKQFASIWETEQRVWEAELTKACNANYSGDAK